MGEEVSSIKYLAIISVLIFVLSSCRNENVKNITQGEIHYSIDYEGTTGSIPKDLMPRTLVVLFRDNKIAFEINAPIGNTGFSTVSNPSNEVYDAYVTIFGAKYFYAGTPGESFPGFSLMDSLVIIHADKTREISGYNCKNAFVTMSDIKDRRFEIWYTDEIKIDQPNLLNPFNEIGGVLMSFFYFIGDTEMKFQIEGVYEKEIPLSTFERKEKYKRISKDDMDKIITSLIRL